MTLSTLRVLLSIIIREVLSKGQIPKLNAFHSTRNQSTIQRTVMTVARFDSWFSESLRAFFNDLENNGFFKDAVEVISHIHTMQFYSRSGGRFTRSSTDGFDRIGILKYIISSFICITCELSICQFEYRFRMIWLHPIHVAKLSWIPSVKKSISCNK